MKELCLCCCHRLALITSRPIFTHASSTAIYLIAHAMVLIFDLVLILSFVMIKLKEYFVYRSYIFFTILLYKICVII